MSKQQSSKELAKATARGSLAIMIGQIISAVLSFSAMITVARLLGPNQYGKISIILTLPALLLVLQDWALSHAITRYVASYHASGLEDEVQNVIYSAFFFELISGTILTAVCYVLAVNYAQSVLIQPQLGPLIGVASITLFGQSLYIFGKSVLIGLNLIERYTTIIILNVFFQSVLPAILVICNMGLNGAIIGISVGSVICGAISIVLFASQMPRNYNGLPDIVTLRKTLTMLLTFSLPLFISFLASGIFPQILYIIASSNLDPESIGLYSVATKISVIISFITAPITTTLFPTFSRVDGQKDKEVLESFFTSGIKYTTFFVIPVSALLILLSDTIIPILLGTEYIGASPYLSLRLTIYFLVAIGSIVVGPLLRGQRRTRPYLAMGVVMPLIGVPIALLTVSVMGVAGLIFAEISASTFAVLIGITYVKKHYDMNPDWKSSSKILVSSLLTIIIVVNIVDLVSISNPSISIIFIITSFITVFVLLFCIFSPFNTNDFQNLKLIFEDFKIISKPIIAILDFLEKISVREKV